MFVHPEFLIDGLAVWAVAVPAGIIVEFHMAAVGTEGDVDAEPVGFAVKDGQGHLFSVHRTESVRRNSSPDTNGPKSS